MEHYYDPADYNRVIYHQRSNDYEIRQQTILEAADTLIARCSGGYDDVAQYQLMVRAFSEQVIESEILQNPSDPEATFREKTGKQHRG